MVTSGFFPSVNGDRVYTAEQFSQMFRHIITDGIFKEYEDELASEGVGLTITIKPGRAWINGVWIENDTDETINTSNLTIGTNYILALRVDKPNRICSFVTTTSLGENDYQLATFTRGASSIENYSDTRISTIGYATIMGGSDYLGIEGGTITGNLAIPTGHSLTVNGAFIMNGTAHLNSNIRVSGEEGISWGYSLPEEASDGQMFILLQKD